MRYLLSAPDRTTYHRMVVLLSDNDVPIFLEMKRRHLLAAGDLPPALRERLDEERVRIVADERQAAEPALEPAAGATCRSAPARRAGHRHARRGACSRPEHS